jgi:hypothetical protein
LLLLPRLAGSRARLRLAGCRRIARWRTRAALPGRIAVTQHFFWLDKGSFAFWLTRDRRDALHAQATGFGRAVTVAIAAPERPTALPQGARAASRPRRALHN